MTGDGSVCPRCGGLLQDTGRTFSDVGVVQTQKCRGCGLRLASPLKEPN